MSEEEPKDGFQIPDDASDLSRLRALKVDPDAVISQGLQEALVDIDEKVNGQSNPVAKIVALPLVGAGLAAMAVGCVFPLEERIVELEKRVKELEDRLRERG